MRAALFGATLLLLTLAGASAPSAARAAAGRCYVTYDRLIWHALGAQDVLPQPGASRCQSPAAAQPVQTTVFSNRQGGRDCRASYDGLLWYRLPPGDFAPLLATQARCDVPGKLTRLPSALVPSWAREDIYSTDPDDLLVRGGFDLATATRYVRALIDAYAAAGETQPLVVVAQQESDETAEAPRDAPLLRRPGRTAAGV